LYIQTPSWVSKSGNQRALTENVLGIRGGRNSPFIFMKHSKKRKGYIWIYAPDHKYSKPKKKGYILQHRYIVENFIGRGLKSEEVIHHLNFKKSDNRISNLMVFSNNN
jgi:hypothetical protein